MRQSHKQRADEKVDHPGASSAAPPVVGAERSPTRRRLLKRGFALAAAVCLLDGEWEAHSLSVSTHRLLVRGLRAPCRIVQLTDLHRSLWVSEAFLHRTVERANALQPDIIALTGDFVTHRSQYMQSCASALSGLQARLAKVAVLGNHDYKCDDWLGAPAIAEGLQAAGVRLITNYSLRLENGLWLAGIDDARTGLPDIQQAFHAIRPGDPVAALTHNPVLFDDLPDFNGVLLAGHTHGGQIYLPGPTDWWLAHDMPYLRGWHGRSGRAGRLYVSRGLGVVGMPMRINAAPEIALFDLVPA